MANILLIGGTGFLGNLIAANLLSYSDDQIILGARSGHSEDAIIANIKRELSFLKVFNVSIFNRLKIKFLPNSSDIEGYESFFYDNNIDEIINSAGAVHYFDVDRLRDSSIDLVNSIVSAAKKIKLRRIIHVSTAFSPASHR